MHIVTPHMNYSHHARKCLQSQMRMIIICIRYLSGAAMKTMLLCAIAADLATGRYVYAGELCEAMA
jgi:hypothetical protein